MRLLFRPLKCCTCGSKYKSIYFKNATKAALTKLHVLEQLNFSDLSEKRKYEQRPVETAAAAGQGSFQGKGGLALIEYE